MTKAVSAPEIRAAADFLQKRKISALSPRRFAQACRESDQGFRETLTQLARAAQEKKDDQSISESDG